MEEIYTEKARGFQTPFLLVQRIMPRYIAFGAQLGSSCNTQKPCIKLSDDARREILAPIASPHKNPTLASTPPTLLLLFKVSSKKNKSTQAKKIPYSLRLYSTLLKPIMEKSPVISYLCVVSVLTLICRILATLATFCQIW